jgi:hypothetical protein
MAMQDELDKLRAERSHLVPTLSYTPNNSAFSAICYQIDQQREANIKMMEQHLARRGVPAVPMCMPEKVKRDFNHVQAPTRQSMRIQFNQHNTRKVKM